MSENKIQGEIFMWYWNNYCLPSCTPRCLMFHVPNQNQHKLKNIGVLSGVSDLVMIHKGELYFVELKTPEGSQSPKQKEFERHVNDCFHTYLIIRSLQEFQNFIADL